MGGTTRGSKRVINTISWCGCVGGAWEVVTYTLFWRFWNEEILNLWMPDPFLPRQCFDSLIGQTLHHSDNMALPDKLQQSYLPTFFDMCLPPEHSHLSSVFVEAVRWSQGPNRSGELQAFSPSPHKHSSVLMFLVPLKTIKAPEGTRTRVCGNTWK